MSKQSSPQPAGPGWRARAMRHISAWLSQDVHVHDVPRTDFGRLCDHLAPADVILVEGRSRVAGIIQSVTLSSWTHAALYVGRVADLTHEQARQDAQAAGWAPDTPLLLEAQLGEGVHLSPMTRYRQEHLRLCRPHEIEPSDATRVIDYALDRIGTPYDRRQIFDLLRFFFPYGLLPRRWRSSLFEAGHGDVVRAICSTLLANAFASVRYPILPTMHRGPDGHMMLHRRNARLITPRDFDHSPYFDVIKYAFFGDDVARYRDLEWDDTAPRAARR